MALIWVMQLARWPSSRVRTSVLTPSHVDRKRVTSFMHSLKPARYFPKTLGSVLSAAAGQKEKRRVTQQPWPRSLCLPPWEVPAARLRNHLGLGGWGRLRTASSFSLGWRQKPGHSLHLNRSPLQICHPSPARDVTLGNATQGAFQVPLPLLRQGLDRC